MLNNNDILSWHESYFVHVLENKDIIAISRDKELLLKQSDYPLFHLIDGKSSLMEIASTVQCQKTLQKFFFLLKKNYEELITVIPSIVPPHEQEIELRISNSHIFHLLSYQGVIEAFHAELGDNFQEINFIYCRSFYSLDPLNLSNNFEKGKSVCLVSINSDNITISPIFNTTDSLSFFLDKLLTNKPVLKFIYQLSGKLIQIPCSKPIERTIYNKFILNKFAELILSQKNKSTLKLLDYNLSNESLSEHIYTPGLSRSKENPYKAVQLVSRPNYNSLDGGSRTIEPSKTVYSLSKFISPITGEVTHIEEITPSKNNDISIFRTAFFKNPSPSKGESINNKSFVQVCLGKGVSIKQSMASALCEAIERKNAQYTHQDKYRYSRPEQLNHRHYNFLSIYPYSDYQFTAFTRERSYDELQNTLRYNAEPIHWYPTWSLSHKETVYVPTTLCFANTPFEEDKFGKWQSNGCAAGNNLEEAILQALFELIERDATAIWWYNKLERPSFDLTRLDPDYLNPLHQTLNKGHDYWVLDLTVDTGVPVMAAIGRHKQSKGLIFGFGCHLKPEMAAQRALTELCQLIPIRNQNGAPFDFDAIELQSYLFANDQAPRGVYALSETLDIRDDILAVVEHLKCLDLETLTLDYTRPPIPIHTAKVFVPGLCHIWPQLGNARLYQTPVKLGWLDEPLNEQTINQQGLYI